MTLEWLGPLSDRTWQWALVGLLVGLSAIEALWPARRAVGSTGMRWLTNLGLQGANTVALLVLAPAAFAQLLIEASGLDLHPFTPLASVAGDGVALLAGALVLDLYAYGLHRLEHACFPLWRFHAVHHSDNELDVSTALRHHPVEVLISTAGGGVIFAVLGIPSWIISVYALLGIVSSLLQHANTGRPGRLDRALRWLFVTPSMHQVHHSTDARDFDTNLGTVFSFWDRLFGTYRARPAGQSDIAFGIEPFTAPAYARPHWALWLPFALRRDPPDETARPARRLARKLS